MHTDNSSQHVPDSPPPPYTDATLQQPPQTAQHQPTNPTQEDDSTLDPPPSYDGVRLIPYSEAILLRANAPSPDEILRTLEARADAVYTHVVSLLDEIRTVRPSIAPGGHELARLTHITVIFRAVFDAAMIRLINAEAIVDKINIIESSISNYLRGHPRSVTLRRNLDKLRQELADIYRAALLARDDDEQIQSYLDTIEIFGSV